MAPTGPSPAAAGVGPMTVHGIATGRRRAAPAARPPPLLAARPPAAPIAHRVDAGGTRLRLRALHVMGHGSRPHRPRGRSQRARPSRNSPEATPRPSAPGCATRSPRSTTPGGTNAPPTAPGRERAAATAARRRAIAGNWCAAAALDDDQLDVPGYQPDQGWRPATGTGTATDIHLPAPDTTEQGSHDHQTATPKTTGDQAREPASPPPATTYEQAQTSYRCTIDARERFEELANRDLSVRAHRDAQSPRHLRPATARRRR